MSAVAFVWAQYLPIWNVLCGITVGRRYHSMKRRFLAWVTAATMLITSVPGNAVTAFAEELPEEVAAEAVSDEELQGDQS